MDTWANNTLRTLGIIIVSIVVIGGSLFLILLALCLGALGSSGGQFHSPSDQQAFYASILGVIVLISAGIFIIAKLAKGISRNTPEYSYPLSIASAPAGPSIGVTTAPVSPVAPEPIPPPPTLHDTPPPPIPVPPPSVSVPAPARPVPQPAIPRLAPTYDVAAHFSPSSRTAIQQLTLAIAVKLAAETVISLGGWTYAYQVRNFAYPALRYSFLAWGLAAAAPMLVLLYALLRHPGPRAFAYSLVIPSLHLFFGLFGHTASIFFLFRSRYFGVPPALSLFALAPWLIDFLIVYLALKVIRLTGIRPNSTRLIVASAVMFLYTSVLPIIVFVTNSFLSLGRTR